MILRTRRTSTRQPRQKKCDAKAIIFRSMSGKDKLTFFLQKNIILPQNDSMGTYNEF